MDSPNSSGSTVKHNRVLDARDTNYVGTYT